MGPIADGACVCVCAGTIRCSGPGAAHSYEPGAFNDIRVECAEELILANDPSGFAFALDAVEHDRNWKARTIQMPGRFVDTHTYSASQLIGYLTDRSAATRQPRQTGVTRRGQQPH